jgi:hypothetical protein
MPSLGYTKWEIPQELFILVMLVLVLLELTQQLRLQSVIAEFSLQSHRYVLQWLE